MRARLELFAKQLRALLGDGEACHWLGAHYATGDGGEQPELQDGERAARWYARGAARGDAECQHDLGFMHVLGEPVDPDRELGLRLLEQSADQGYCEALRVLVDVHSGRFPSIEADPARAEYFRRRLVDHLEVHPDDRRTFER